MYCYVDHVADWREGQHLSEEGMRSRKGAARSGGTLVEKLIHLALPVRLVHMENGERSGLELACTYDIHPHGARLRSSRDLKVGDLVTVERGRTKSVCEVVWAAAPDSPLRGQFTVECVEGARIPWEDELRKMEEHYLPVIPDWPTRKRGMNARSAWTAAGMSAALLRGENRLVPFVAFDFKPFEPPVSAAVLLRSSTEDHIQQQAIVGPEHVGPGPAS